MLLFFVVLIGAASLGVKRLKEEENLLVFLPAKDPDVQLFRAASQRFGALRVALIGVEAPEGHDLFEPDNLRRIAEATKAFGTVKGRDRVQSMTNLEDIVGGPDGARVEDLIKALPTNAEEAAAVRKHVLARDHVVGNFVSADGRAALIYVFLFEGVGDKEVTSELHRVAEATLRPLQVYYGGAPFAGVAIYQEAQGDVRKLSPLALLVLLLGVILSFRDPVGVGLTIVSVAVSTLVVLGGMGWLGDKFTVASSTLPVMLFASGSSYAVHVLGRYYLERKDKDHAIALDHGVRTVGPPLLIAAATTSVGFLSFVSTDVKPMRAFGIACGAGVLLCWFTAMTLVPAVVALLPRKAARSAELGFFGRFLVALWHWARRHRFLVIFAMLGFVAAALPLATRVAVRMEPSLFFRPGSEPWLAERFMEQRFDGGHFVQIWVKADLDDPATQREVQRLIDYAASLDGVTRVNSIFEPLTLVHDGMGFGRRLPATRQRAANLYFFLEGQTGISALLATGRREALLNIRYKGEGGPLVDALSRYIAERLQKKPTWPDAAVLAERVGFVLTAQGHPAKDLGRVANTLKLSALPGEGDEGWLATRAEVAQKFVEGEDAPPLSPEARQRLVEAVKNGGDWKAVLLKEAASPEEGELDAGALGGRLEQARRELGVERTLPQVIDAAGLAGLDGASRAAVEKALRPVIDDRFVPPPAEPADRPIEALVAGEPILARGFTHSVERSQNRSLLISIGLVLALLFALFRRVRLALVCMAPALVTLLGIYGAMGAGGLSIDLGTSLIAGIATGAGSDFAMHYMWYLKRQHADEVSRSMGPIMVLSVLLVSFGFAVMSLGESPVMRLFGLLAGASLAFSALFTVLLVPALLNKVGPPGGPILEQPEAAPLATEEPR